MNRASHHRPSPRRLTTFAASVVIFCGGCVAAPAGEEDVAARRGDALEGATFTLWIHGRNASGKARVGDYDDFSYWGSADVDAGPNKKAVNWDGRSRISESNEVIRRALDCFCTGPRSCVVAAHSAGDAQIGYALSLFGGSERPVTDGAPDASGACGDTGATQTGWNIAWVDVAGGASGGTELADLGYWAVSDPLTSDLRTSTARSLYDHNETQGVAFYRFAGSKGAAYAGVLPGQDDSVIAYHSSGGLSSVGSFCNPGDWLCDGALRYDAEPSTRGKTSVSKWANHRLFFRDDAEERDHYPGGAWGGITGPMREDVVASTN
jgi:hypothetical protein